MFGHTPPAAATSNLGLHGPNFTARFQVLFGPRWRARRSRTVSRPFLRHDHRRRRHLFFLHFFRPSARATTCFHDGERPWDSPTRARARICKRRPNVSHARVSPCSLLAVDEEWNTATHLTNHMFDGARADLTKILSVTPAFQVTHTRKNILSTSTRAVAIDILFTHYPSSYSAVLFLIPCLTKCKELIKSAQTCFFR